MGLATGREVPVVYMERHSHTGRVDMWRHTTGPAGFLLLGGVTFLGAAVLISLTN
ncbi:hypothetical protein ACFU5O_30560 [Streptomyces sp. NPDC057445]|uniref:hypothetical protein n=1 Tax=Streptomyces sp. NPDC057445 TaxID=3346136 RepID=UPI0036776327